jgi:hypothetical protein
VGAGERVRWNKVPLGLVLTGACLWYSSLGYASFVVASLLLRAMQVLFICGLEATYFPRGGGSIAGTLLRVCVAINRPLDISALK